MAPPLVPACAGWHPRQRRPVPTRSADRLAAAQARKAPAGGQKARRSAPARAASSRDAAQERREGGERRLRRLLGQVVAAVDRLPLEVARPVAPDGEDV